MKRIFLGLVVISALAGCTAAPAPQPIASSDPIAADVTCKQFSTLVLTPLGNADAAFREGRFSEQELNGMRAMAARSLASIDVEPDTDVAAAITLAQGVVVDPNLDQPRLDPSSQEWSNAATVVTDACAAEGFEVYTNMWTGG